MSNSTNSSLLISWFVPEPKWMAVHRLLRRRAWDPDLTMASVWIRGFQVAPYLIQRNYQVRCNITYPLPNVAIFLRRYGSDDVVLARKLKSEGVRIILDVIVNYFQTRNQTCQGYGGASQEIVDNFLRLVDLADQVWTVSPFLQQIASRFHPNVHFISDSVDPKHFIYRENRSPTDKKPITLGWSGIYQKVYDLEMIAPVLKPLIDSQKVKVLVITNKRPTLSFPFEFCRWRYYSFPAQIARCDLCIAPRLVDNDYDRGHSIFKIGAFMAMGVPALASPVPSYELLLRDGRAGVICNSPEDWDYHLNRYITNDEILEAARLAAQEKIMSYLTPVVAGQIDELIDKLSHISHNL